MTVEERLLVLEREFIKLTEKFNKLAELADAERTMLLCLDEHIMQLRNDITNHQRRLDHQNSRILHIESLIQPFYVSSQYTSAEVTDTEE